MEEIGLKLRVACAIVICILSVSLSSAVAGAIQYRNYNYGFWGEPVPGPQAYILSRVITGNDLGVGPLREPADIFVRDGLGIFLLDTGNSRIICMDEEWRVVRVIDSFQRGGQIDRLNRPMGLFVTEEGHIYVTSQGDGRVVVLDQNGNFVRQIGKPETDIEGLIPEGFVYRPSKVVVDQAGRTYVLATDQYEGLLEFDVRGRFKGFIGAPRVRPSLADYIWRKIATRQQRERMGLFLPTEFTSIDLDSIGFIYATVPPGDSGRYDAIRRLNPSGEDVLRRQGFHSPIGDVKYAEQWTRASVWGPSIFVDIAAQDFDVYSALDGKRGRVFTYDGQGNLLYVFGNIGDYVDAFSNPVAIDTIGRDIVIVDSGARCVKVFKPTEYANTILSAIECYYSGRYEESTELWSRVLSMDANCDLAYQGIGQALLGQDRFREAMDYFRLGNDRTGYSEAFGYYRREVVAEHFGTLVLCFFVVLALIYLCVRYEVWSRLDRWLAEEDEGSGFHRGSSGVRVDL